METVEEKIDRFRRYNRTMIAAALAKSNRRHEGLPAKLLLCSIIDNSIPNLFSLSQNYPNPFNPITRIDFSIPENDNVTIEVYDNLGRFFSELFHDYLSAGRYSVDFDSSNLPNGIYLFRLSTSKKSLVKKAVLKK